MLTNIQSDAIREFLQSPHAGALGQYFASAFARFTHDLIKCLSDPSAMPPQASTTPAGRAGAADTAGSGLPADAPDWIRQAYTASVVGTGPSLSPEAVESIIIRDRILEALHERKMTQAELARRLKKAPPAISRILKSPTNSRIATLQEIAKVLGIDVAELLSTNSR